MSHHSFDLCVLLVDDAYGELASKLYSVLLRRGRATVPALQRHTQLSLRQIRHELTVLIQHNLVFWCQQPGDDLVYEANPSAAYNLVRTGKYVKITASRVGEFAATIMARLLLLGPARVADIIRVLSGRHEEETNGQTNGANPALSDEDPEDLFIQGETNGDASMTGDRIYAALIQLLRCGLMVPAREADFRSDEDNAIIAHRMSLGSFQKAADKITKAERELQEKEERRTLHQWTFGTRKERDEMGTLQPTAKRPLEDPDEVPRGKRQRLGADSSKYAVQAVSEEPTTGTVNNLLDHNLVIRVNHHKFKVMMRTEHLAHMAEKAIGSVTSQIYRKALEHLESEILECKEEYYKEEERDDPEIFGFPPRITTHELAALLEDDPKYADALGRDNAQTADDGPSQSKDRREKTNGVHDEALVNGDAHTGKDNEGTDSDEDESSEIDDDSDDDLNDLRGHHDDAYYLTIRQHLLLLSQHPNRFLVHIHATKTRPEKWRISSKSLRQRAILQVIFHTIESRLGTSSTRLARLCQQYGRMDDKSLQSKSLLTQKETRALLLDMQKRGLLDLQEVPRDNSRLASRTTFLYYMDEIKTAAKIRDECYQTMVRCIQRLGVEREKVAGVLEKVERSDVKGREDELLGAIEKDALGRWRKQEEAIWGEIGRVDGIVAVLRDF